MTRWITVLTLVLVVGCPVVPSANFPLASTPSVSTASSVPEPDRTQPCWNLTDQELNEFFRIMKIAAVEGIRLGISKLEVLSDVADTCQKAEEPEDALTCMDCMTYVVSQAWIEAEQELPPLLVYLRPFCRDYSFQTITEFIDIFQDMQRGGGTRQDMLRLASDVCDGRGISSCGPCLREIADLIWGL